MDTVENSNDDKNLYSTYYSKANQDRISKKKPNPDWLIDGSQIAEIIRAKDWSATPLGPIEQWSQTLRTTISLCLASTFPINILWGTEGIQIYNSGYKSLCGAIHPQSIGISLVLSVPPGGGENLSATNLWGT